MDDLTNRSPKKPAPTITAEEIARRRKAVEQADANNRIEGIFRDPASDEIFEAFIRGDIELDDLVPRLKAGLGIS
jgi:hypothetical protein